MALIQIMVPVSDRRFRPISLIPMNRSGVVHHGRSRLWLYE